MKTGFLPPQPPSPPYDLPLNSTMQTIATAVLWGGTAVLLFYAVALAKRERSILPVVLIAAVAVGSLIEPLYDISYHLFWLDAGRQWTLFTSFGLPQPVWVMPAYVMVFGMPALLMYRSFARGVTLTRVFKLAALTSFTTAVFEITAINLGLYVYYGESPWRVLGYPLFISFMEGAQITGFAVLAALLSIYATKPVHCLALFAIFPGNFALETLGAGFPTVILQNSSPNPNPTLLFFSAFASVGLAATALWWTTQSLLAAQRRRGGNVAVTDPPVAAGF